MPNEQLWEILIPVLAALASCITGIIALFTKLIKSKKREADRLKEVCELANQTIGALKVITAKDEKGTHTHTMNPNEMLTLEKLVNDWSKLDIKNYKEK